MSELEELARSFEASVGGDPWYGASAGQVLAGVDASMAGARAAPGTHTIWEILLHATGWMTEVRRRLEGDEPSLPPGGDWPAVTAVGSDGWSSAIMGFRQAQEDLCRAIRELPAARLEEMIGDERIPELGTGVTCRAMLIGLLQHNAYHLAQISLLRRLLGGR